MIRHVVMWKFKAEAEGKTREENMAIVRERLYALLPVLRNWRSDATYLILRCRWI